MTEELFPPGRVVLEQDADEAADILDLTAQGACRCGRLEGAVRLPAKRATGATPPVQVESRVNWFAGVGAVVGSMLGAAVAAAFGWLSRHT